MKRDVVKTGLKVVGTLGTSSLFGAALSLACAVSPCGKIIFASRYLAALALSCRAAKISREETDELVDACCELGELIVDTYEEYKGV